MNLIPLQRLLLAHQERRRAGMGPEGQGEVRGLVLPEVQATQEVPAEVPEGQYREPVGVEGPAAGARQEYLLLQPCVVDDPW